MKEIFVRGLVFASGVACVAIVAWLAYLAYDTRQKALRGDAAAAFIERVNAPPPQAPAAEPAPTPAK